MRWRCLMVLLGLAVVCWADEVALVRVGESWQYFKGYGEPSLPPAAWPQPAFDDATWDRGPSGFGTITADDATFFYDLFPSLYLRRQFELTNPARVRWLVLRIEYVDGFVAYLNGVEIARRGLAGPPNSFVPFDALADSHSGGTAEEIDVTPFIPLLVQGTNVLAIQGHKASRISYYCTFVPELLANFTRGPLLQDTTTNSTLIVWKTPIASDSTVEYGPDSTLGTAITDTNQATTHVVRLTGLLPDTTYYYRVRSAAGDQAVESPGWTFRTLKMAGPVRFVVVGDTGYGTIGQYQVARVMQAADPELVMHVGDVVYPMFTAGAVDTKCFSVYQPQMRSVPFFFAVGNHDRYANTNDYLQAFYLPTNSATGTEEFYSFDDGDVHFVVLDTVLPTGNGYAPGSPQYQWLEADLAASRKPWKFLFFHNTIRNSGYPHRYDDYNGNLIPDRIELQNSIGYLAGRYQVQVIFTGHDHTYERLGPVNGTHTIISGGGGAVLYSSCGFWDESSSQFWSRYNCVRISVSADALQLEALAESGGVFDTMFIQRTVPPPQTWRSSWHTPVFATGSPDDGDGNRIGQRFDFAGRPIPALTGQFSNLGRVYVNNDQVNLYLGIEQAMIGYADTIFLFIEAPAMPGIATLAGLGNGIVDPQGQGADGLDFLENLSFTNFTPAVACLVGDEFADGQSRGFGRLGAPLNTGQGVFRLDPGFSDVQAVQIQQFNRSPQTEPVAGDQNANFIKVAIPLSTFGRLGPGDVIKLGAVVGGAGMDTNVLAQARQLDTGFLGRTLSGSDLGRVALEGLEVRLADPPAPGPRLQLRALGNNRFHLTWPAVVGDRYFIEATDGVTGEFGGFDSAHFPLTATSPEAEYDDDVSGVKPAPRARFYRLRIAP